MKRWLIRLIGLASLAGAAQVFAVDVAGVDLASRARVGDADLVLNGAGIRKRVIISVYVGALYLAEKKSTGTDAVNLAGAKRVHLHMLREVTSAQLVDAMKDTIKTNTPAGDLDRISAELTEFYRQMGSLAVVKAGEVVTLDFLPGQGTMLAAAGKALGPPIVNPELYKAVLRIFIGEKPVDDGLKKGMLGG